MERTFHRLDAVLQRKRASVITHRFLACFHLLRSEKIAEGVGLVGKIRSLVSDMFRLRCLLDIGHLISQLQL